MDPNEEDGILPILNQVKAFQSKWIAKNKQCETLDSFLTTANAENKHLRDINEQVKSHLKSATHKNTELESTCEILRSDLNAANAKNEKLESECKLLKSTLEFSNIRIEELRAEYETSKSSLDAANTKNRELGVSCETLESALMISNAKIKIFELKCKELDIKCAALESFSNSISGKNKELEIKLDEAKKEVMRVTVEKKKLAITTLKKIQLKLLTNPLYAIIDRLKCNISSLERAAHNSAPLQRTNNEIELVDIASSDDDDNASTLSFISELHTLDDEFNSSYSHFNASMSPDNDKGSIDVTQVNENTMLAELNPYGENNQNVELVSVAQNCNADIQNEIIDDLSRDSNISLSVSVCADDVSSTTGEEGQISLTLIAEEHSYSDRASNESEELLPEWTSSECTSTIVNQSGVTNQHEIEKRIPQDNPVLSLNSQNKDEGALDRNDESLRSVNDDHHKIKLSPVSEPVSSNFSEVFNIENVPPSINQNANVSECDNKCEHPNNQINDIFAELTKKYGKRLKLLHPVVLLTPVEHEREDAAKFCGFDNSHSFSSSNCTASKKSSRNETAKLAHKSKL